MGKNRRGVRDGTGPHKDSFQKRTSKKGRRQLAGEPCPKSKSKKSLPKK